MAVYTLKVFSYANWVRTSIDERSAIGFCTFVGGNLVTWKIKKQSVVARSSVKVEYRAMTYTICELIWIGSLLQELHIYLK